MRIVFIDGSLSEEKDAAFLIERMIPFLKKNEYGIMRTCEPMDRKVRRNILKAAEGIVIVTPLISGNLPSSLTALLSEMEMQALKRDIPVCSVIYGESMDRKTYEHAENVLKIWGDRCHVRLCMNIQIQGSGQLRLMKDLPVTSGFMRKMNRAFADLAEALNGNKKEDVVVTTGSAFLYRRRMEAYWKKELQKK